MSTKDSFGDTCDDYDINPDWCGLYDTANFISETQCCICHNLVPGNYIYNSNAELCYNNLTTTDSFGDNCD